MKTCPSQPFIARLDGSARQPQNVAFPRRCNVPPLVTVLTGPAAAGRPTACSSDIARSCRPPGRSHALAGTNIACGGRNSLSPVRGETRCLFCSGDQHFCPFCRIGLANILRARCPCHAAAEQPAQARSRSSNCRRGGTPRPAESLRSHCFHQRPARSAVRFHPADEAAGDLARPVCRGLPTTGGFRKGPRAAGHLPGLSAAARGSRFI